MPRFFFHVYDDTVALDADGRDLPNRDAAEAEAVKIARQMACAEVSDGHLGLNHRVKVADANGAEVLTVSFTDAVAIHP